MQARARELMFNIFKDNLKQWSLDLWMEMLNIILVPLLDDIHLTVSNPGKNTENEFYRVTTQDLLESFISFLHQNARVTEPLMSCFVDIVCCFVKKTNEKLIAQTGVQALKHFMVSCGSQMSDQTWDQCTDHICDLFQDTTPRQLLLAAESNKPAVQGDPDTKNINQEACFTQCIVQLCLIQIITDITDKFYDRISEQNMNKYLMSLETSHEFASKFNSEI